MAVSKKTDQSDNLPVPELHTLAPEYNADQHSVYVSILKRAIESQPEVRNIALAGTYGTGKSSILSEFSNQFSNRVIEVSLLTLGVEPESSTTSDEASNPAATTTTNRIQKEIVKQLLYQQRPSAAPESRFRRIARFRWLRELFIALGVGLAALAILIAAGLDMAVLPNLGLALEPLPAWLRTFSIYLAVPITVGLFVLVVRLLIQGRFNLERVSAGPATITLPPRSSSYFDEYLDEIIYFFETNPANDIVLFEDLDRFNDPRIFEALRSLNSLLNAAKQLGNRNIRFIYAVRDSVFEKLGRDSPNETTDEARAELVRANRTKFFELVIPIVPFITHKNARDLMHELLTVRGHKISKDLVDLAARHVADMRLIHNIVNEFEVFEDRLLSVPRPVPELDPERLFAMILFKNAHMADFEAIRQGTSSLDKLYDTWRLLVNSNLQRFRTQETRLRSRIETQLAVEERATALAQRLRSAINVFANAPGNGLADKNIRLDGVVLDDARLATPAFWRTFAKEEQQLTLTVQSYYNNNAMALSFSAIETLLGEEIDLDDFAKSSVAADRETIRRNRTSAAFLRRHTWQQLFERPQLKYAPNADSPPLSFREWAEQLLPSRLAFDLVVSGYITPYFTLHVSSFYGQLIRPDAMTYVMRCIDRGIADPDFSLDGADVDAILRDQGTSVLNERSMFNVSVLDHLLTSRPADASIVVRNIAGAGSEGTKFIDQYLSAGTAKPELISHLAPHMPEIFTYIASDAPLEHQEKVLGIEAAIGARSEDVQYDQSDELRSLIESAYLDFPALTGGDTKSSPSQAIAYIAEIGVSLPSVVNLSEVACKELAKTHAYRITAENLERLGKTNNIALDILKAAGGKIYAHAVANIGDYLLAHDESAATVHTIEMPSKFMEVLNASDEWRAKDYTALVLGAHPDCAITELTDVPTLAWPALASGLRIPSTYLNVAAYIDWAGEIDERLSLLLNAAVEITGTDSVEEEERAELAISIVNASSVLPDAEHRVSLALSLDPGQLPTTSIDPDPGELIGRLIGAGLISDGAEAFAARLIPDWSTLEYAITKSSNYRELLSPETLASQHVAPLVRSSKIHNSLRREVINKLSTFPSVPQDAYQAIADSALQGSVILNSSGIEMVRQGGVPKQTVVDLLVQASDRVTNDELQQILRKMGEPYSLIADKGRLRPKLADTPQHRHILERLQQAGIVSKFVPGRNSHLSITLRYA